MSARTRLDRTIGRHLSVWFTIWSIVVAFITFGSSGLWLGVLLIEGQNDVLCDSRMSCRIESVVQKAGDAAADPRRNSKCRLIHHDGFKYMRSGHEVGAGSRVVKK